MSNLLEKKFIFIFFSLSQIADRSSAIIEVGTKFTDRASYWRILQMNSQNLFDQMANLLGIFSVDFEEDFSDDGYTDLFGLTPLDEPLVFSAEIKKPQTAPLITVLPGNAEAVGSP